MNWDKWKGPLVLVVLSVIFFLVVLVMGTGNLEVGDKELFKILNCPLLVGVSRKSMIYKVLHSDPEDALNGTTALNTISLLKGAKIVRVHDVKQAKEVIKMVNLLLN